MLFGGARVKRVWYPNARGIAAGVLRRGRHRQQPNADGKLAVVRHRRAKGETLLSAQHGRVRQVQLPRVGRQHRSQAASRRRTARTATATTPNPTGTFDDNARRAAVPSVADQPAEHPVHNERSVAGARRNRAVTATTSAPTPIARRPTAIRRWHADVIVSLRRRPAMFDRTLDPNTPPGLDERTTSRR